jgi:hypothetical protein
LLLIGQPNLQLVRIEWNSYQQLQSFEILLLGGRTGKAGYDRTGLCNSIIMRPQKFSLRSLRISLFIFVAHKRGDAAEVAEGDGLEVAFAYIQSTLQLEDYVVTSHYTDRSK